MIKCLAYRSSSVFTMTPLASFLDRWVTEMSRTRSALPSSRLARRGLKSCLCTLGDWETYVAIYGEIDTGWNWVKWIFQWNFVDHIDLPLSESWNWWKQVRRPWSLIVSMRWLLQIFLSINPRRTICVCVSLSCIMTISLSWGCHQQQHHHHQHHCHVSVIILINGITAIIMRVYINSRHHGRVQATSHGCTCKNHVQIMFNTQWHETQLI